MPQLRSTNKTPLVQFSTIMCFHSGIYNLSTRVNTWETLGNGLEKYQGC